MAKIASIFLALVVVTGLIETSFCVVNIIDIYKNVVFDYAVMKNPKPVVVFYYSSSSCGACIWSIKPMLERMAKRKDDKLYLALVDFDKVPDLQTKHGINQIPTTRVLYKGELVDSVVSRAFLGEACPIGKPGCENTLACCLRAKFIP